MNVCIVGGILIMLAGAVMVSISIYVSVVMMVVGFFVWLIGLNKNGIQ